MKLLHKLMTPRLIITLLFYLHLTLGFGIAALSATIYDISRLNISFIWAAIFFLLAYFREFKVDKSVKRGK